MATSTGLPTRARHRGHVWTWDFVHDRTVRRGELKRLTVVDEFTRKCHLIQVDRLIRLHGPPEHIRSDNGSESKRSAR